MNQADFRYYEYVCGSVANRNKIFCFGDELPPGNVECYHSVYLFTDEFKKFVEQTGSVANFNGECFAPYIILDFDNANDLERARCDALEVVRRLKKEWDIDPETLKIYFSGAKGFHIFIPSEIFGIEPSVDTPEIVRKIALKLADNIPIDTSIYNRTRFIRIKNSRHGKTRLFKIPISVEELEFLKTDEIKTKAEVQRPDVEVKAVKEPVKKCAKLLADILADKADDPFPVGENKVSVRPEFNKHKKICIQRLIHGEFVNGRNEALLLIGTHYVKEGFDEEHVRGLLEGVNAKYSTTNPKGPVTDKELDIIVKQSLAGYDYGCNHPTHQALCDQMCYLFESVRGTQNSRVVSLSSVAKDYCYYVDHIDTQKLKTGYAALDEVLKYSLGTLNQIVGSGGVGKSSIINNMLTEVEKSKSTAIYFSMEMAPKLLFERFGSMFTKNTSKQIEEAFKNKTAVKQDVVDAIAKELVRTKFCFKQGLSVDDIEETVKTYEHDTGDKVKLVILDNFGQMNTDNREKDPLGQMAKELMGLSKRLDVCITFVNHTTKAAGGDGNLPLPKDAARDSGKIYDNLDSSLNVWRPFYGTDEKADKFIMVQVAKNRWGQEGMKTVLLFDKKFGIVRDPTEDEIKEFHSFLAMYSSDASKDRK